MVQEVSVWLRMAVLFVFVAFVEPLLCSAVCSSRSLVSGLVSCLKLVV